jgi:hypothetical protein
VRWNPLSLNALPTLGESWRVVDGLTETPKHLQGSLLLALMRQGVVLAALPDGRTTLWVRTPTTAFLLKQGSMTHFLAAQQIRQDRAWFLALLPGADDLLPAGSLRVENMGTYHDIFIGDMALLTPAPNNRPWDWAWNPTLGPVYLKLFVDRTAEQLRAWLQKRLPNAYRLNEYGQAQSTLSNDSQIFIHDGELTFSHGYHNVPDSQYAADALLLRAAAQGEMGELTFDIFDCDYGALCASGYSCESLADYLTPRPSRARQQQHRWRTLPNIVITVPPDSSPETYIPQELNRWIGLPPDTSLSTLFQHTPIQRLPRYITIQLPMGMEIPAMASENLSHPISSRVRWLWRTEVEYCYSNAWHTWSKNPPISHSDQALTLPSA